MKFVPLMVISSFLTSIILYFIVFFLWNTAMMGMDFNAYKIPDFWYGLLAFWAIKGTTTKGSTN